MKFITVGMYRVRASMIEAVSIGQVVDVWRNPNGLQVTDITEEEKASGKWAFLRLAPVFVYMTGRNAYEIPKMLLEVAQFEVDRIVREIQQSEAPYG